MSIPKLLSYDIKAQKFGIEENVKESSFIMFSKLGLFSEDFRLIFDYFTFSYVNGRMVF